MKRSVCFECAKKEIKNGWFISDYGCWDDDFDNCMECGNWAHMIRIQDFSTLWEVKVEDKILRNFFGIGIERESLSSIA